MSANFHTALPDPVALTTANLESPLSELDQAITNLTSGVETIDQLNLGAFTAKTIASGAITGDKTLITVDTEASAASDDLDNITGGAAGDVIILKIANGSRVVTVRNNGAGTGNIRTHDGLNVLLTSVNQLITLVNNGTNWIVTPNKISAQSVNWQSATISGGAFTYTSSYMAVDTEASASTDNLDTINGGVLGAFLFLTTFTSTRDIVIRSGIGNIITPNNADITLDQIERFVLLVYNNVNWIAVQSPILLESVQSNVTTSNNSNKFRLPYQTAITSSHPLASSTKPYLDLSPLTGFRQVRTLQALDTTLEGSGFGTLSVSGTPNNAYAVGGASAPGAWIRFQSGASSGNLGGVVSPFACTSVDSYPTFRIIFRTYNSIAVCRFWIGLSSAALGNTDSPSSAGTHFMGLRYSTVVPDSFWQFVTSDGSTTTATSTTVAPAADNTYELLIAAANTSITMYFRNIANPTYQALTTGTTLPAAAQALGLNARVETREAAAKSLQIYTVSLHH